MYNINLLPNKLQKKINIDIKRLFKALAIAFIMLGILGGYCSFLYKIQSEKKQLILIERRLEQINPQVKQITQLTKERMDNERKLKAFQSIAESHFIITPMLEDIVTNMPVDFWLTEITIENKEDYVPQGGFASPGEVQGNAGGKEHEKINIAVKDEKSNEKEIKKSPPPPNVIELQGVSYSSASIGFFIDNMSRLPYFRNVDLLKLNENTAGGNGQAFTIRAQLREARDSVSIY